MRKLIPFVVVGLNNLMLLRERSKAKRKKLKAARQVLAMIGICSLSKLLCNVEIQLKVNWSNCVSTHKNPILSSKNDPGKQETNLFLNIISLGQLTLILNVF